MFGGGWAQLPLFVHSLGAGQGTGAASLPHTCQLPPPARKVRFTLKRERFWLRALLVLG